MNFEDDDLALEEGRIALYQLERQLNDHRNSVVSDKLTDNSISSRQASLNSERKLLDQMPRDARLINRKGLGITIEKLDEKGLLDGGASIPSYNTSLKQKNRRRLEMKNRESRLRDREEDFHSKLSDIEALFHMIRTLVRRGFNISEYFLLRDTNNREVLHKNLFIDLLDQLGFPFTTSSYDYILTKYYNRNDSNYVDYYAFLSDCQIYSDNSLSIISNKITDFNNYITILSNIKDMLYNTMIQSNRSYDDIYRLFSRWDISSTGEITTIQFLRELYNLKIFLNDLQQDYIVELLDSGKMGKINFENLLDFIFSDNSIINHRSPVNQSMNETETNLTQSRPIPTNLINESKSVHRRSSEQTDRISTNSPKDISKNNHLNIIKDLRQRPMTASGRVSSNSFSRSEKDISTSLQLGDEILVEDTLDGEDTLLSTDQDSGVRASPYVSTITPAKRLTPLQKFKYQENFSTITPTEEPHDHLSLLATQTLTTMREILLTNYRNGWLISDIFKCFDKNKKSFISLSDFISTLSELKIELSERVATIAMNTIAINFKYESSYIGNNLSIYYGEFKVFMLDPEYDSIEEFVIKKFVSKYEIIGRRFEIIINDIINSKAEEECSVDEFMTYVTKINVKMNDNELDRIVMRFATIKYDNNEIIEYIFFKKFFNVIITSKLWHTTNISLRFQDESLTEAEQLRSSNIHDINLDLLDMATYLGIKPISESHLLWIAHDALNAPMPANWIVRKDKNNNNYFFNTVTKQSRWDHPLDPHFRKLRDSYRNSTKETTRDEFIKDVSIYEKPEIDSPSNIPNIQSASSLPLSNEEITAAAVSGDVNNVNVNLISTNNSLNRPSSAPNRIRSNDQNDSSKDSNNYDKIFSINSSIFNNKPIKSVEARKILVEAIYKAPYLVSPVNTVNELINNSQTQKRLPNITPSIVHNGLNVKAQRHIGSNNSHKSKGTRPTSAVDRIVNLRETPSHQMPTKQFLASVIDPNSFKLLQTKQKRDYINSKSRTTALAEMYDENLIKRLDTVIINNNVNK